MHEPACLAIPAFKQEHFDVPWAMGHQALAMEMEHLGNSRTSVQCPFAVAALCLVCTRALFTFSYSRQI